MRKYITKGLAAALAVCCVFFSVCTSAAASTTVEPLISKMTLKEKIGQMLTIDIRGWTDENGSGDFTEMNDTVGKIIADYSLGGIILFTENLQDTEQIVRLTHGLQQAALESKNSVPLFIGTDQEGGDIVRINSATTLPGNMALGAIGQGSESFKAGEILGKELSALGINTNYAPSLDVNNNPQNPVIGLRSFSSDPSLVGKLGVSMINGMQQAGVVTAVKHFPGHGNTATDSHFGLPVVDKSLDALKELELVPFVQAIDENADMVMTAHIQFPQIEKETVTSMYDGTEIALPATLSKSIITDILRKDMGFNGVVTTDAMNMEAIAQNFGTSQAAVLAINAGVDMLLMPVSLTSADTSELDTLIEDIEAAAKDGTIAVSRIDEAVGRILKLKEDKGILNAQAKDVESLVAQAKEIVGSEQHHEIENNLAASAVTVLKNEDNILPFKAEENQKAVLIAAYSNEMPGMEYALTKMMAQGSLPKLEYTTMCYNQGNSLDEIIEEISTADFVVTLTEMNTSNDIMPENINTSVPTQIMSYTKENGIKNAMVSIAKPYDLANYSGAQALLAAYGANGMNEDDADGSKTPGATYGPNIPAVIEVVFGISLPWGKLPVDVPAINQDGTMSTEEVAFTLGQGIMYENTEYPYTQPPTEPETPEEQTAGPADKADENSVIEVIIKLLESVVVRIIIGAVLIFIIILILVKRSKKKSRKHRYKR